jgi:hypothetical protein
MAIRGAAEPRCRFKDGFLLYSHLLLARAIDMTLRADVLGPLAVWMLRDLRPDLFMCG